MAMPAQPQSPIFVHTLKGQVVFPQITAALALTPEAFQAISQYCEQAKTTLIGIVTEREEVKAAEGQPTETYAIGTYCEVKSRKQEGSMVKVQVEGKARFRVLEYTQQTPHGRLASVELLPEVESSNSPEVKSLVGSVQQIVQEVMQASAGQQGRALKVRWPSSPGLLADMVGAGMGNFAVPERQQVLEELDVEKRLALVLQSLRRLQQTAKVSQEINEQMQKRTEAELRENILRRQIGELQGELRKMKGKASKEDGEEAERDPEWDGEEGDEENDLENLKAALTKANLPEETRLIAKRELKRLASMQPQNPEYTSSRTYLELVASLPWRTSTEDCDSLSAARQVLDRDHYGMEKVKKRILEFLAVQKLRKNMKGPILCLHGPPGVGKTSLGHSVAEALGRKFHRIALGGVRDESELRGHRRTYIGSMPGAIIEALRTTGVNNPVILLDEIDKLTSNAQGNPSAALLEILDPEQNHTFKDHYMNTPFDLSNVLFLATCNEAGMIERALYDRMEVIDLSGYTVEEKTHIATTHLLPKQRRAHALEKDEAKATAEDGGEKEQQKPQEGPEEPLLEMGQEAIQELVQKWTAESGVRSLERQIAKVCRFASLRIAESMSEEAAAEADEAIPPMAREAEQALANCGPSPATGSKVVVLPEHLPYIVGMELVEPEIAERLAVGVSMGLAVSGAGGSLMFVEASKLRGDGRLEVTGQVKDVMRESVRIGLSLLRSKVQSAIEKQGGFRGTSTESTKQLPSAADLPTLGDVGGTGARVAPREQRPARGVKLAAAAAAGARGRGEQDEEDDEQFTVVDTLSRMQRGQSAPELFGNADLHVHFPAGGIPKDGPSAGVAITLALASLFLNQPVRSDTAVTGEITLRGHVLPVGGIKDKVLAAHRAGLKHVILPEANRKHVKEELSASITEEIDIRFVKHIDEAFDWAFAQELSTVPLLNGDSNAGGIVRASEVRKSAL